MTPGIQWWDLEPRDRPNPHYIYRVFDAEDRLLYIGVSNNVAQRMKIHAASTNPTSRAITTEGVRVEISEPFATKRLGHEAERAAIAKEAPLLNQLSNPRRFQRIGRRDWRATA